MRLIFALALAGVLLAPVPAVAQDADDCTVNLERVIHDHPLVPSVVQIGTAEKVEPPFFQHVTAPCGDDWLEGVQVRFRNVTNRTVIGVRVHVDFPDTEGPQVLRIGYEFSVGETPRDKPGAQIIQQTPLQDLPRSVVAITLKPEYSNITQVIERQQPVNTIHSVWIRILRVYFVDGTRWNGAYQRPDPNDPAAYIKADPSDFRIGRPVQ